MPPNHFESEVESFLEGSHGDRTHIKRADHHTVTPLCGTLLAILVPLGMWRLIDIKLARGFCRWHCAHAGIQQAQTRQRYTLSVAMHPIRSGAMPTDRVHHLIINKCRRGTSRPR